MAARVRTDGATIAAKLVLPRDAADRLRAVDTRRRCARHWPTVAHEPDPVRGCLSPRAKRAIERDLPEAIAFAVVGFLYGPLAEDPYRIGKPLRLAITG
jgi:hypothetical protein